MSWQLSMRRPLQLQIPMKFSALSADRNTAIFSPQRALDPSDTQLLSPLQEKET